MPKRVHVIGAGLAGLSAAVRLAQAGIAVTVHEATRQAGGRCRSYDDAATGMHIDNGTHLLLSGNHAAIGYLNSIGVAPEFAPADFHFVDGANGERWVLRLGDQRVPWWMFSPSSRVPGTGITDYLKLAPLLLGGADRPLREVLDLDSELYRRLLDPLMVAALNIDTPERFVEACGAGRARDPAEGRSGMPAAGVRIRSQYRLCGACPLRFCSSAVLRCSSNTNLKSLKLSDGDALGTGFQGWQGLARPG